MKDHTNCPKCNYPKMASGNYFGFYIDGFKCDGCGYLNEVKNKELKEKIEKSHKETENYKKEMKEKVSKLKKPFRAIK